MILNYNKNKIIVEFGPTEAFVPDPYVCKTREDRIQTIKEIEHVILRRCTQEQQKYLKDFNIHKIQFSKDKGTQIELIRKPEMILVPTGTTLYYLPRTCSTFTNDDLQSTNITHDNILFNEDRVYFVTNREVVKSDVRANNEDDKAITYDGTFPLYADFEFETTECFFAASNHPFKIKYR